MGLLQNVRCAELPTVGLGCSLALCSLFLVLFGLVSMSALVG